MKVKKIQGSFSICKVKDYSQVNLDAEYVFLSKTDEEKSLVCLREDIPENTLEEEHEWTAFRLEGVLDFSLVGILAKITSLLAQEKIPVFAISTYNTDYILVKTDYEMKTMSKLAQCGYYVLTGDSYGDYFMNRTAKDVMGEYSEQKEEWDTLSSK